MKITLLSTFAALTLMTGVAYAEGEGAGDPFPFRTQGVVTVTGPAAVGGFASARTPSAPVRPELETASAPPARMARNHH